MSPVLSKFEAYSDIEHNLIDCPICLSDYTDTNKRV